MEFRSGEPEYLDRRLCSVEIFVPSQVQHPDHSFGLMANAWFGTVREDIETASGIQSLTFGFHTARLELATCDASRMSGQGCYRSAPLSVRYESQNDDRSDHSRSGSAGGGFSIPFLRFFNVKASGEVSQGAAQSNAASLAQEATYDVHEVDTGSPNDWALKALNPARPEPCLTGAELREVTLCTIETPQGHAEVQVSMTVAAEDIWLARKRHEGAALEDEANQNAVLGVLMAKAVSEKSEALEESDPPDAAEDRLVIARCGLSRRKPEDPA